MNLRSRLDPTAFAVLLVCIAGFTTSCSSTPETDETSQVAEQPGGDEAMPFDVVDAYRAAAGWIPQESSLVISGTSPASWYFLDEVALPTANPDAEPGAPGTLEGLESDIETLFVDHIGFDPTIAEAVVIGTSLNDVTAVLFGEFGDVQGQSEVKVNGRRAYEFSLYEGEFNDIDEFQHIYAMPIDDPRPGLVITMGIEKLERLESARQDDDGGMTLASGQRGELFDRLIADASGSRLAVASPIGEWSALVENELQFPLPQAFVLNYGDHQAGLTLEGDDKELAVIEGRVEQWLAELQETMQDHYDERDGELVEELTAIYGYHGLESMIGQLQPEHGDGRIRYEMALTDMNWGAFSVMSMFIFASLFDAIDPLREFSPPGYDFGAPRAETAVRDMAAAAAAHFEQEQHYCTSHTCDHPWYIGDPGELVPSEERVFPGGTDVRMVTMEGAPIEGESMTPHPMIEGDVDFDVDAITDVLGIDDERQTDTRYIYETGPGTGVEATASITAETMVDADDDRRHRVTQRLVVDGGGYVQFTDPIVDEHYIPVDGDDGDQSR